MGTVWVVAGVQEVSMGEGVFLAGKEVEVLCSKSASTKEPVEEPITEVIMDDETFDLEVTYTTSIMKTKAAQYEIKGSEIIDFTVALCMFTRSLILKRRVEDLQLGVESYQKKLNITKPQKTFPEIEFKEPYTPSYDPPGIVYEDMDKQKRVLRAGELCKFSDGTLKSVRDEIHHIVLDFRLDYNPEMP
nr:hypothetical protein [Tanacetum cinerariifolium]